MGKGEPMDELISRLSELRCQYNCFDENDRDAYHTLSEAIKALSDVPDTNVGDMISRQWLMECVNEGWIKFDTEKDENRFIHLVRDIAPSSQPNQRWIPCSERLPAKKTEVIYTLDNNYVSTGYMTDRDYNGDEMELHWEDMESGALIYPEAWMPIPDPYKEERKDDEQIRGFGL